MKLFFGFLLFVCATVLADDAPKKPPLSTQDVGQPSSDTSASQNEEPLKLSVEKGLITARDWTLVARLGAEQATERGRDGRVEITLRGPKRHRKVGKIEWNRSGGDQNGYLTQESEGFLFNPGVDIAARIPFGKELVGPAHTIVDAEGFALWSYRLVLHRMSSVEPLANELSARMKRMKDFADQLSTQTCAKLAAAQQAGGTQQQLSVLSRQCEEIVAFVSNLNNISLETSYPSSLFGERTTNFLQLIDDFRGTSFYRLSWSKELDRAIKDVQEMADATKAFRDKKNIQPNELISPFLVFEARFFQTGATYEDKKAFPMKKLMGTASVVKLSIETAVLFGEALNLAIEAEADPFQLGAGTMTYSGQTRNTTMRSEAGLGASLTYKGVIFRDKVRLGFNWAFNADDKGASNSNAWDDPSSMEVRNYLSVGYKNIGKIGWEHEYENYTNLTPVHTNIFFLNIRGSDF